MDEYLTHIKENGSVLRDGVPTARFGTHHYYCGINCGYTHTASHSIEYTYTNLSNHTASCDTSHQGKPCAFTSTEPHLLGPPVKIGLAYFYPCIYCLEPIELHDHATLYISNPQEPNHYKLCLTPGCGYIVLESHSGSWIYNDFTTHKRTCTDCGSTNTASHSLSYTGLGNGTHNRTCSVCGNAGNAACSSSDGYVPSNNGTEHRMTCDYCFSQTTTSHTYGNWSSINGNQHRRTCSLCSHSVTANHTKQYGYNSTHHYETCNTPNCGYSYYEQHNNMQYSHKDANYHYYYCGCGYVESYAHTYNYGNWTTVGTAGTCRTRTGTCGVCNQTTTETQAHSTWKYGYHNATQHKYYCFTCNYTQSTANHVWSYGAWGNVGSSGVCQARTVTCTTAGCEYAYGETKTTHTMRYGQYTANQHKYYCSTCNYTQSYSNHSWSTGAWVNVGTSGTCRKRTITCTTSGCGYSYTETQENHSMRFSNHSTTQHKYHCSNCTYVASYHNHGWGSWSNNGTTHSRTCSTTGCGASQSHNQSWGSWYNNGTNHRRDCSASGCSLFQTLSHTWGAWFTSTTTLCRRNCSAVGCSAYQTQNHVYSNKKCIYCGRAQ